MKRILLPTDFSTNARHAIDYALSILEKEACTFYLLNTFEAGSSGLTSTMAKTKDTHLFRAMKQESERKIKSLLNELKSKNENTKHKFEGLSVSDSLLNSIGRISIDKDVNYIFMGTKGSSAIKEIFMGSNTVSAIKNLKFCPLIAVPENSAFRPLHEIAFATNFEHMYAKAELIPLIDLAKLWDSEIAIVHVDMGKGLSSLQETGKNLLSERFHGLQHQFKEIRGTAGISEAIKSYSSKNKETGMIAMVNYRHGFFENFTKGSVIKRVAFFTEVPFLTLPLVSP
ncbi:MAG TPA: universal stress protein [Eudoraea sp.]|nr:universal stress protein [Eudoraea sp.]